jgi:hypothetical protein
MQSEFNQLSWKQRIKQYLTEQQAEVLKKLFYKGQDLYAQCQYSGNLEKLCDFFHAGKCHWYLDLYAKHFHLLRHKRLNILEIGIGGYDSPKAGGGSLRMWKAYFPNSQIFGIDIYDKRPHQASRIKTFQGSQVDEEFLNSVVDEIGELDVVIDDGSHMNSHVIQTFKFLFPHLQQNGFYIIEDTQTSYWDAFGGAYQEHSQETTMSFLKSLTDGLNYEEFPDQAYLPTYYDRHIKAMHFYHNIVFIEKGLNNHGSNILGKRDEAVNVSDQT